MTVLDAMRMALEALEYPLKPLCMCFSGCADCDPSNEPNIDVAITNLRAAIAEMERAEPVAWMYEDGLIQHLRIHSKDHGIPLFTHPAAPSMGIQNCSVTDNMRSDADKFCDAHCASAWDHHPDCEYGKERPCNPHPDAPHGFDRTTSHSLGRYVCDCEGWEPKK